MNERGALDAWKASLRKRAAPDGFVERVSEAAAQQAVDTASSWPRLWALPAVRIAAFLAASLVLALRIGITLGIFVTY